MTLTPVESPRLAQNDPWGSIYSEGSSIDPGRPELPLGGEPSFRDPAEYILTPSLHFIL
jgi:hypothetical protein